MACTLFHEPSPHPVAAPAHLGAVSKTTPCTPRTVYWMGKRRWNWEISFLVTTIILYLHKVESCSSQCLKLVLGTFHYTFPLGRQTLSALCSRPRTSWSIVQNYPTQSMYSSLDGESHCYILIDSDHHCWSMWIVLTLPFRFFLRGSSM